MEDSAGLKKDWVVSQQAFEGLLAQLDSDREAAGEKYEQIRQKLIKFFHWRNCPSPDELADRTIDRVTRRLAEGAGIQSQNVYLFFHGVAINVLREHWKDVQRHDVKGLDDSPAAEHAGAVDPYETIARETARGEHELRLECLDGCVRRLPAQHLVIITRYHHGEGGAKIAQRNELAKELGIPINALRIRAFRIRGDLETCVEKCIRKCA